MEAGRHGRQRMRVVVHLLPPPLIKSNHLLPPSLITSNNNQSY